MSQEAVIRLYEAVIRLYEAVFGSIWPYWAPFVGTPSLYPPPRTSYMSPTSTSWLADLVQKSWGTQI